MSARFTVQFGASPPVSPHGEQPSFGWRIRPVLAVAMKPTQWPVVAVQVVTGEDGTTEWSYRRVKCRGSGSVSWSCSFSAWSAAAKLSIRSSISPPSMAGILWMVYPMR